MRNLNFICKVLFLLKRQGERTRSYLKQSFKTYFSFGSRHMKDFLTCLLLYSRLLKLSQVLYLKRSVKLRTEHS